jgi:hypothetical protein
MQSSKHGTAVSPSQAAIPPATTAAGTVSISEVMTILLNHQEKMQQQLIKTLLADRPNQAAAVTPPPQNVMLENSQINNQTNNNQSFNLQFFLNEECKNAMNFSDFINTISVTIEDIKHLGEVGYTAGMSRIITKALRDSKLRPMHCTDAKRETMYVKENNQWHKDTASEESKKLIQHITQKNYKALAEWRSTLPDQLVHDTEDYETWYQMSRNMCNTDPSAMKKLIRHLTTVTAIEKS